MKETEKLPTPTAEDSVVAANRGTANENETAEPANEVHDTSCLETERHTSPSEEQQNEPPLAEKQSDGQPQAMEQQTKGPQAEKQQAEEPQHEGLQDEQPMAEEQAERKAQPISFTLSPDCSLEDSEREALMALLATVSAEMSQGEIGSSTLHTLLHALHHDRDVAQASHEGEVRGRNTNIEQFLTTCRETAEFHQLGSGSSVKAPTTPLHLIGGLTAADRKSIWERGSEKRTRNY